MTIRFLMDRGVRWGAGLGVGMGLLVITAGEARALHSLIFGGFFGEPTRICVDSGSGTYSCSDFSAAPGFVGEVAVGDFNVDGITDVIFANNDLDFDEPGPLSELCLGDSGGGFTCTVVAPGFEASGVAVGDLNEDGNVDALFTVLDGTQLCLGDGSGGLSCTLDTTLKGTWDVALGYIDDDAHLDAAFASGGTTEDPQFDGFSSVCFGDGSGAFSCVHGFASVVFEVAVGDFDGDGNDDVAWPRPPIPLASAALLFCRSDGMRSFLCGGITEVFTFDLILRDVNGDGQAELISGANVCEITSLSSMTCDPLNITLPAALVATTGDINGDGHVDVVLSGGPTAGYCLGDGTGNFTCSEFDSGSTGLTLAAAILTPSSTGRLNIIEPAVSCNDTLSINVTDGDLAGTATVTVDLATTGGDTETVTLNATAPNSVQFAATVITAADAPVASDGILQVAHGDVITATYNDADDGTGSPAVVQDTASVDCLAPGVVSVTTSDVGVTTATVSVEATEPVLLTVQYGLSCGALTSSTSTSTPSATPEAGLQGLVAVTDYFYAVEITDPAGNSSTDDNGGICYSFTTLLPQVDHFVAYKINAPKSLFGFDIPHNKLPKDWVVTVNDTVLETSSPGADNPENFVVKKEKSLLLPARKNDEPAPDLDGLHYIRYQAKPGKESVQPAVDGKFPKPPKHISRIWHLDNQLGDIEVQSNKVTAILVPAHATQHPNSAPAAPDDATHFVCYQVKPVKGVHSEQTPGTCDKNAAANPKSACLDDADCGGTSGQFSLCLKPKYRKDLQAFFADQFDDCATDIAGGPSFDGSAVAGMCLFDLKKVKELCNPMDKSAVEGERVSSAVIEGSTAAATKSLLCYQPGLATSFKNAATAGLATMSVGDKIDPKQRKHLPRRTRSGNPVYTAPGNLFPAPVVADTSKQELVCIPTDVLGVSVAP